jgi:hypothetical protein
MLVNLMLFSGIYYMKQKDPDNNFLSLKLNAELLAEEEEDDDFIENRDNYDHGGDPRSSSVSAHYQVTTAYDRSTSVCSDTHMESIEKVRSLSFV